MGFDDDDDNLFHHRRNNYELNSKIMLTAIISLSAVVLVVTLLHIYARCVLRRQARRQRRATAMHRLGFISSPTNTSTIPSIEPPKTGLDPSVMASLPIFVFKKTNVNDGLLECSVCLSMLEDGEIARTLPNCKHTFHAECIDKWFGSNSTCPVCRTDAKPRLAAEPREGMIGGGFGGAQPSAPPLNASHSTIMSGMEGTSDGGFKIVGSSSRLSSFRKMLTREKSSSRIQTCGQEDCFPDLERQ